MIGHLGKAVNSETVAMRASRLYTTMTWEFSDLDDG